MRKIYIIGILLATMLLLLEACGSAAPSSEGKTDTTLMPTSTAKEVELKYDDGTADGSASAGGYSFRVHFSPPATPFTISKVKLFASLRVSGYENQPAEVRILSQELALLYSYQKPTTEFSQEPSWITVEIPNVTVNKDFYVYFYTNSTPQGGVYLHYDSSVVNARSEFMLPSGEVATWTWPNPKEKTNWMIRVIGTAD